MLLSYALATMWQSAQAGQSAAICQIACLSLQRARTHYGIDSELQVVDVTMAGGDAQPVFSIGSLQPRWHGREWTGYRASDAVGHAHAGETSYNGSGHCLVPTAPTRQPGRRSGRPPSGWPRPVGLDLGRAREEVGRTWTTSGQLGDEWVGGMNPDIPEQSILDNPYQYTEYKTDFAVWKWHCDDDA